MTELCYSKTLAFPWSSVRDISYIEQRNFVQLGDLHVFVQDKNLYKNLIGCDGNFSKQYHNLRLEKEKML